MQPNTEWLEANGLGGYASSTACGMNTRRYHGLLVAATKPPVGRMVLLSKLDERVGIAGTWHDLSTNQFPGAMYPRGANLLLSFERALFPVAELGIAGVRLRKTVAAIHGENTTVILYELLEAPGEVTLELRPFIAARDHHNLVHANDAVHRDARFDDGVFALQPYDGVPTLYINVGDATFHAAPDWYFNFEYAMELERGLDAHEDLFTPGTFSRTLAPGGRVAVIASIEDPAGRNGVALIDAERQRRSGLNLAADQFIVRRGENGRSIIAGYHWFTDWGRDTMIALPGLCLATGRFDDAQQILRAYAECVSEGMLPNRFPDSGEAPEYNTADATLWFFVAAWAYLEATGDDAFVRGTLLPVLRDIVAWHTRGTRHNIHEDADGLLVAGVPGDQLTWMDVKIGDWVVTPRHGKAVEINALWYNALSILAVLDDDAGMRARAARTRARFREVFWNGQYLDDVENDASIRPNQIFALSLPFPLLEGEDAASVLAIVEQHLLTPVGLRTLSPSDPRFIGTYAGPPHVRDAAYHQGTVWPWLLGPYITALLRVRGDAAEAQRILDGIDWSSGSVPEIFDGAPPHRPRGCIAQAWSVGELLRATVMLHPRSSPPPEAVARCRTASPESG
ncbi:MAG TPA: amylo-alpha-1,6-glucosidase [Thermoanaerobaculia bacterium]|nr:amylo-alpha-1,6-glucosidase [Thermoanaerobaculia bacterium]